VKFTFGGGMRQLQGINPDGFVRPRVVPGIVQIAQRLQEANHRQSI